MQTEVSPTAPPGMRGADQRPCCCHCRRVSGRGVPGVPGGARGYPGHARNPGGDECIYGVPLRPGRGRGGAINGVRAGPEPVPEQCHNGHDAPPPVTRHPTPVTRHPHRNVSRVFSYSVLGFPWVTPGISDLWLNSDAGGHHG